MRREELAQIIKDFEQKIIPNREEVNREAFLECLEKLREKLESTELEKDERFIKNARREFLKKDTLERLESRESEIGKRSYLIDVFYNLKDYIENITWSSGFEIEGKTRSEIGKIDSDYKDSGIICKEEKDELVEIIENILKNLNER